ncbi:putative protein family (UPF0182) [Abditibacterium utsteinense]|uniref:Uncharacterized protein n=2 Tax=Abditibacterium utsteinense TaxID=1960156 RepID=A0A2S8STN7_9BACT|nr:putative protein family (UPF0182) [Abditibacterium utsteinense]
MIWAFDKLIFLVTQRSFFASVGLESWFWRQLESQIGLFCAFFGICLGLTQVFLGALVRTSFDESIPLRGILAQFRPLRIRVARLSWIVAILLALVLSHDFARHSFDWIFLRSGARSDFTSFGLSAALWTHVLPVLEPFVVSLWRFSVALGILLLATGILRALPLLAARNAAPPQLSRVLWRFGAWLWAVRAALYAIQLLDLNRGKAPSSGDLFLLSPFFALGFIACLVLCVAFLRRAGPTVWVLPRRKSSKIVLASVAALFLPAILSALTAPLRAFLPETAFLKSGRESATRIAWQLHDAEKPVSRSQNTTSTEQLWPVWNETLLLASRGGAAFRGARVVTWQSATLSAPQGKWSALVAGESAGASAWNSARDAGSSNALAIERLDLGNGNWQVHALPAARPAFFGLEGRSLFSEDDLGISLSSFGLKWAWAWRLRDLFLPVDAQNSPHLLTFRGARERAQILAPFLRVAGEPQLVFQNGNYVWSLDLCAVTNNFPGAMTLSQGEFAGENGASAPLQMRMDARTGKITFAAPRPENASGRGALLESWRAAFPEIRAGIMGDSRKKWSAGSLLLRAEATIAQQLKSEEAQIHEAQTRFDAQLGEVQSVLAVRKNSFEIWQGAPSGSLVARGTGDVRARLERLDSAVAQSGAAEAEPPTYRAGEPFLWRDERAPGGFWIARGFFASPRAAPNLSVVAGHGPLLWRVALGGIADNSRVGVGNSLGAAFLVATGQEPIVSGADLKVAPASNATLKAPLNSKAPQKMPLSSDESGAPLEVVALRTHRELQAAARRGDWKTFGALAARETVLLERLAARRKNLTRRRNSTKNEAKLSPH